MILYFVNVNIHSAFEHNDFDGVLDLSKIEDSKSLFLERLSIHQKSLENNWELLGSVKETDTNYGTVLQLFCAYNDLSNIDTSLVKTGLEFIENDYSEKILAIKKWNTPQLQYIVNLLSESSIKFIICYE